MRSTHIALLALALCGCVGDRYVAQEAPRDAGCPLSKVITVQLFGDSTQVGWDGRSQRVADRTPGVILQERMDAVFGAGRVKVSVRAVSGTTLLQLMNGTDGLNSQPWPAHVEADVVVVNHGVNDARDNDLERYRAALRQLSTPTSRLIFETPNTVTKNYDVRPYAQAMRQEAARRGVPVADVHEYTSSMVTWPFLIPDHYHPTSRMYELIVANVLAPAVTQQVRAFCT
jgi:lysophospholipase L1-like esterase